MKNITLITCYFVAASSLLGSTTWAREQTKMVSANQVVLLARAAISEEVEALNRGLALGQPVAEGYRTSLLEYFLKSGKNHIDPAYVMEKCILAEENIRSLFSETLSSQDDALTSRKNSLLSVKGMYGRKVWKLMSKVCVNARQRFIQRLQGVTESGIPLAFTDDVIEDTANLVFFPTNYGRPSLRKSVNTALNLMVSGAMVVGATGALVGIPAGGVVLIVVTLVAGGRGAGFEITGTHHPYLDQLRRLDEANSQEVQIDLNSRELCLATK